MKLQTISQSTLIKTVIFAVGLLLIGWELAPGIQAANLRAQVECGPNAGGSTSARMSSSFGILRRGRRLFQAAA